MGLTSSSSNSSNNNNSITNLPTRQVGILLSLFLFKISFLDFRNWILIPFSLAFKIKRRRWHWDTSKELILFPLSPTNIYTLRFSMEWLTPLFGIVSFPFHSTHAFTYVRCSITYGHLTVIWKQLPISYVRCSGKSSGNKRAPLLSCFVRLSPLSVNLWTSSPTICSISDPLERHFCPPKGERSWLSSHRSHSLRI